MLLLYRLLFVLLLLSWLSPVMATTPVALKQNAIQLAPYLELLEDPSAKLSFDQITQPPYTKQFQANTMAVPDFGRTRSTWWARFQLTITATQQDWYLLLNRPIGGALDVFVTPNNALLTQHPLHHSGLPICHLQSKTDETVTIYVRVNNGSALLTLPLELVTGEQLINMIYTRTMFLTALATGMIVLAIYNLLWFFSLREPAYLSLALFIGMTDLLFLRDSSLFTHLEWLQNSTHYFYHTPLLLAFASGFHYWKYINQGANQIMTYLCYWIPPIALLAIPFIGLLHIADTFIFWFALALIPILIVSNAITAFWHKHESTRNAYWFMLVLLLGVTPYALMQVGYLTYDTQLVYLAQCSMLLALFMLSFEQGQQTRRIHEAKERIETASKIKDEFLTTISHELRTPMNAVLGINTLLNQTPLNSEQRDYTNKLDAASRHLLRLIDEVLDLSRMQQTQIELVIAPFQLASILNELQHMFSVLTDNKQLRLNIPSAAYQTRALLGDATRLTQILTNLLSNAIKCTERGEISLLTHIEQQDFSSITLRFAVLDTGIGIAPEHLPHLFEPFYQIAPQQRPQGSGLGLSISSKLVARMGGQLSVESTLGKGSHFYFTVCFPLDAPLIASTSQPSLHHLRQKTILLVDDDEINLFVGSKLLSVFGANVITATNGAECLQRLTQQTFDLVFMDVSLPDQSGYDVVQSIRAQPQFQNLPIIALTAHTIAGIRERCLAAGMNDFLGKPFTQEDLLTVTARWLLQL